MAAWTEALPAVGVHRDEDRLGEEREAFDPERDPEDVAEGRHEVRPQPTHFEGQDRSAHDADGDRRDLAGPLLFGQFIHSGNPEQVATGFLIGAAAMALGGIAELRYGVRAEQRMLEDIAAPLSTVEAEEAVAAPTPVAESQRDADQTLRERVGERRARERSGMRRYRPGPGQASRYHSPGMLGTAGDATHHAEVSDRELDREAEAITRALADHGQITRRELEQILQSRDWGPGRYRAAVRAAVAEGRADRSGRRGGYGPPGTPGTPDPGTGDPPGSPDPPARSAGAATS